MLKLIRARLVILVFFFGFSTACYFATREVLKDSSTRSDFGTLTGTLASAKEYSTGKSRGMTFFIEESHVRFRIGPLLYKIFDRDSFFENVKIGDQITLTALKSDLANPTPPKLGEQIDTTFISALSGRKVFLSLEDSFSQREKNSSLIWIFVVLFGLAALFFLYTFIMSLRPSVRNLI